MEFEKLAAGGLRCYAPEGSLILIRPHSGRFRWTVTYPKGTNAMGFADSESAAKNAAVAKHRDFIVALWERGVTVAGGNFLVPIN